MIYNFKCEGCNAEFELSLPIAECRSPIENPCPHCNELKVHRVFESTAIVSGSMDVHTRAEQVGGDAYKEVMKNIKKAGGKFGEVNI